MIYCWTSFHQQTLNILFVKASKLMDMTVFGHCKSISLSREGGMCASVGREEVKRTHICMYWTTINLQDRLIDNWQQVTTEMVRRRTSGRLSNHHDKGTGTPNNGFLRNTLKTLFRLSRVRAIKFVSLQSTQGNLSLFEITRASGWFPPQNFRCVLTFN